MSTDAAGVVCRPVALQVLYIQPWASMSSVDVGGVIILYRSIISIVEALAALLVGAITFHFSSILLIMTNVLHWPGACKTLSMMPALLFHSFEGG